jgi:hypothetical protein
MSCIETYADSAKFITQTGPCLSFSRPFCKLAGIVSQSGDPVPHISDAPKVNTLKDVALQSAPGVNLTPFSSIAMVLPLKGTLRQPT